MAQQLVLGVTPHQRILNPDLLQIDTFVRNLFFFLAKWYHLSSTRKNKKQQKHVLGASSGGIIT